MLPASWSATTTKGGCAMGFMPLESDQKKPGFTPGFTPLAEQEEDRPGLFAPAVETIKDIGRVYPVLEAGANLATQAVALPVAGLAGLGAVATKAAGITEAEPADVVHQVGGALTYQPVTESGRHLTGAVLYPFEKLQQAGQYLGGKTLDATGSPALATVVDTAVNALPLALPMAKGPLSRAAEKRAQQAEPTAAAEVPVETVGAPRVGGMVDEPRRGFVPLDDPLGKPEPELRIEAGENGRQSVQTADGISSHQNPAEIERGGADGFMGASGDITGVRAQESMADLPVVEKNVPLSEGIQRAEPMPGDPLPAEELPRASESIPDKYARAKEQQADFMAGDVETGTEFPAGSPARQGFTPLSDTLLPEVSGKVSPETKGFNPVAKEVATEIMPETAVDSRASWAPGANYTGFVDRAETSGKLADKPIRREEVLVPLMKELGVRVYEGRVKGKNRLGTYLPNLEAVRIRKKSDLEVAAHEIAHLLDDRIPAIRESWLKGPMAKIHAEELRGVSYDKSKVFEGFAEFSRLYLTQPEKAKTAAPNFFKWFDQFTQQHKYGPAIKKAQADMGAWFGQDALHRAQSKIDTRRAINEALDGVMDKFRQSSVDDYHGIYRMERELTGKTSPLGAYETSRLTRGSYAMVDGAIRLGRPVRMPDGRFEFQGKGLEKILEPVADRLDEFLMYAVGKSSQELMMQGREKLFSPAEIRAMVQLDRPEFRKAFAEYQEFNKGILDFAQEMGVINPQSRAMWQRSQYLPFYRVEQGGAAKRAGGVEGNWQGIRKLTGGTDNLRDILGNMTQNASMLMSAALKNEARAKIAELAEQPGGGRFMVRISGDSKAVRIDKEQIKDAMMEAMGIDPAAARRGTLDPESAKLASFVEKQIAAAPGFFEFWQHNQAPKGNIMAVLKDGKPTYYEVADPLLFRAISSMNRPAQHWLVKLLGIPKRVGQATITLTPDFMVANIARDTIMGAVMSRGGFIPVVDSIKGMASRIKQDPAYQEFIANGGGMASYLLDETNMRAHLEQFYTSKGINPKTVLDAPDKVMYAIETIADAFEMSTRLGEYKRLREQGAHPRHAAYAARDISTDFAMKGDSQVLGFMYDTVMFLRPAVVSMDRLYRGLAHDPNKGAIAAKSATIAAMSAALYLLNRDNPRYDELEDWDKDSYWHFFIPRPDGDGIHLRYPKIWEIGALASVAERTMQHLQDGDAKGYGKETAKIIGNVFNLNLMPQVIAPLAEQATNKNSFTGRPIETQGMEDIQPFMRAKPTTSETLKAAGMATRKLPESLQVNPVRAEALVRGYFNTWGMYGLMLADQAFFGDKLPEKRLDEMPVARRFYEGEPAKHTKFESQFYDMLGEAKRLHTTMRALDKMNRPEIADEIEQNPMASMDGQLERASKNLHGIDADMEMVRRSDLTPAEKRQRLDSLTIERNMLLKDTVQDVKAQRGGK